MPLFKKKIFVKCENLLWPYKICESIMHVVNGMVVKPFISNLNVYTSKNDKNIIYVVDYHHHDKLKLEIKFGEKAVSIIANVTE